MGKPALIWSMCADDGTITVTDTLSGTSAENVRTATEDTWWSPANVTGTKYVQFDFGAPVTFDALAILGSGLAGVTFEVRASTDNFVSSSDEISAAAAIPSSTVNATWRGFESGTYRYWRFGFTTFSSDLALCHVVFCERKTLPYFSADWDPYNVTPEGEHVISHEGLYLGAHQQNAMRDIQLPFGEVTASELVNVSAWSEACVKTMRPFFLVPDVDETGVFFGWTENSFKAPLENGLYNIGTLTMKTRA